MSICRGEMGGQNDDRVRLTREKSHNSIGG
jgi:hypothetical protein